MIDPGIKKDMPMSEQEKIESYIAMCKCCLLAQAMKKCPLCRFNIGLAEEVALVEPRAFAIPLVNEQTAIFAMVE